MTDGDITLLLIEDQTLMRQGLRTILELEDGFRVLWPEYHALVWSADAGGTNASRRAVTGNSATRMRVQPYGTRCSM